MSIDDAVVALSCRFIIVGVFLSSGIGKSFALREFERTLKAIGLPMRTAPTMAVFIVCSELALAILCAVGVAVTFFAVAALALLASFFLVSGWAALAGRTITCNCFGGGSGTLGSRTAIRALLLTAPVLGYVLFGPVTIPQTDAVASLVTAGMLATGVTLLAGWLLNAGVLLSLVSRRRQRIALLRADRVRSDLMVTS
jgi:hypothetical protein